MKCTRCNKNKGEGTPPICNPCYSANMREGAEQAPIWDKLADRAMDRGAEVFNSGVDRFLNRLDGYAKRVMNGAAAAPAAAVKAGPPARQILHFGPKEAITKEQIKERRKQLALMCHPDAAGSVDAMQRINEAADALLKEIG